MCSKLNVFFFSLFVVVRDGFFFILFTYNCGFYQKDKEDLEEIVNELELVDEEEKVPFVPAPPLPPFPFPFCPFSPPHHLPRLLFSSQNPPPPQS